jgi:hypothetical protein
MLEKKSTEVEAGIRFSFFSPLVYCCTLYDDILVALESCMHCSHFSGGKMDLNSPAQSHGSPGELLPMYSFWKS